LLKTLRVPTWCIGFPKDPFTSGPTSLRDTSGYATGARVAGTPRGGYFPAPERPARWAKAVGTFCASLARWRGGRPPAEGPRASARADA
jgi:hypothetical protein